MSYTLQLQHDELVRDKRRLTDILDQSEGSLKHYFEHIAKLETALAVQRRDADTYAKQLQQAKSSLNIGAVLQRHKERIERLMSGNRSLQSKREGVEEQHAVHRDGHEQRRKFFLSSLAQLKDEMKATDVSVQNILEQLNDFSTKEKHKQIVFADRCDVRAAQHATARAQANEGFRLHSDNLEKLMLEETMKLAEYYKKKSADLDRIVNEYDLSISQGDAEILRVEQEFEGCKDEMIMTARAGQRLEELRARLEVLDTNDKMTAEEIIVATNRVDELRAEIDVRCARDLKRDSEVNALIENQNRSIKILQRKLREIREIHREAKSLWAAKTEPLDEYLYATEIEAQAQQSEAETARRVLELRLKEAAMIAGSASDRLMDEQNKSNRLQARMSELQTQIKQLRKSAAESHTQYSAMTQQLLRTLE